MAGTVHYNLEHAQVAALGTTPTWLDVPGSIDLGISITSNANYLAADGSKPYVAYSAPEGSFDLSFAEADFAMLAVINGGTASTSGTTPAIIERYEQPGTAKNPSFALSGYASNVNGGVDRAGFRVTLPNAKAGVASPTFGQETWGTWSTSGAMAADENDVMVIYEKLETAPTFTAGVMPVNLVKPGP